VKYHTLLPSFLLTCLLNVGQSRAEAESITLRSSQWITPVKLTSVTTLQDPGVTLEYGLSCLAEAGNRLRKLVHNFGRRGFVLMQYRTPYTATEGHCPSGTLFFLREQPETALAPLCQAVALLPACTPRCGPLALHWQAGTLKETPDPDSFHQLHQEGGH
jgi:hypothetical protein